VDSQQFGPSDLEFIRVWAHEVAAYQARGWALSYLRRGFACEALLGPSYADCLMVREVKVRD